MGRPGSGEFHAPDPLEELLDGESHAIRRVLVRTRAVQGCNPETGAVPCPEDDHPTARSASSTFRARSSTLDPVTRPIPMIDPRPSTMVHTADAAASAHGGVLHLGLNQSPHEFEER